MAVEYEISSDVATIKGVAPNTQVARVVSLYSGQITYDDEAGSKFATATINGKSQRVMLCIAVNGTVNYDDVPCLYSTVDGHRCLNIVAPTETGTPDDVPSVNETVVIDGMNVRAVRCILINATPVYDGVSSVCTFTGDDGKTHTAQLVNKITGGSVDIIVKGVSPISLPDAIADSLEYLKAFGGTEQRNLPAEYTQVEYIESDGTQYIDTGYAPNVNTEVKINFSTTTLPSTDAYMFHSSDSGNARVSLAITQHLAFFGDDLNDSRNRVDIPAFTANTAYDITVNKDKAIVNGTEYTFTHTSITLPTMNSMGLFGSRTGGLKCQGRVKSFSCNENNVLRINLIPCRRNSDSVLGMYDTVTNTFLTNAGTGSFTAGADVTTPSPDYPMDIVSNNGVVKARHQSGLPLGYTLLDYIESSGTQYIDTGYKPNTNTAISIKYYPAVSSTFMCIYGTQDAARSNRFYGLISSTQFRVQVNSNAGDTPNYWGINNDGTLSVDTNGTFAQTQGVVTLGVDNKNKVISVKSDEYTGDISASDTVLGDDLNCSYSLLLMARGTAGTAGNNFSGRIYSFSIKDNNILIQNLIPCKRNSDNVLGMYDLVNGKFFTNAGTGTFVAGNTVSDPVEIYADGTVETINVPGKNLFDSSVFNTYVDTTSTYVSFQIPNGTYTMSTDFPPQPNTYYTNVWVLPGKVTSGIDSTLNGVSSDYPRTFTVTDGWYTVCYRSKNNNIPRDPKDYNWQVEQGSTATDYEPYYNGDTAVAEMLLKVGDYEDVQEILSGAITRNVGVKAFDGTENWTQLSATAYVSLLKTEINLIGNTNATCLMTSLKQVLHADINTSTNCFSVGASYLNCKLDGYTSAAQFKQFLASQYNAGTPMILVYPLATPTTESVAGQAMQVQQGDNIVEITQASLDNLELEAKYQAAVSLTIQEVQDANLDPNVQVTIN